MNTGVLNASANGNIISYNGSIAQNIKSPSSSQYYNLIIGGALNKTMQQNLIINGNLTINSATLNSNNFNLEIKGDWYNKSEFTEGTGEVSFTGTSNQTLSNISSETFYSLLVNKTAGELVLTTNVTATQSLTLTSGIINTGTNVLTVGTSTSSLGSFAYSSGYIIGKFEQWTNGAAMLRFPIGINNNQQVFLTLGSITTGGSILAQFIDSDPGNNGLPLVDGVTTIHNTFVEGYWDLSAQNGFNLGGNSYDLQLNGVGFTSFPIDTETRILTRANAGSNWIADGSHLSNLGSTA